MTRALCIVLDSVGGGHAPDAVDFGDGGADTLGHLFARIPDFVLPHLASLGLYEILRDLGPAFPLRSATLPLQTIPSPVARPPAPHELRKNRSNPRPAGLPHISPTIVRGSMIRVRRRRLP